MTHATIAKVLLTAVVAVGGTGFLVYSSVGHAQHYKHVDELVTDGFEQWADKELKVEGQVVPGSLVEGVLDHETQRTFVIDNTGKRMRVFSKGPTPDAFNDTAKVVATGRLVKGTDLQALADQLCKSTPTKAGSLAACPVRVDAEQTYVVQASELSAKCPSKYGDGPTQTIDPTYK
jgi:cytochrome c-type biogenesis protein CcmE